LPAPFSQANEWGYGISVSSPIGLRPLNWRGFSRKACPFLACCRATSASTAAVETFLAPMAYNAIKAALITYAKQLSQTTFRNNVRVNTVSPGPIYFEGGSWEAIRADNERLYNSTVAQQPSGRMGTPEEVARCVAFLASPAASWVNGVNLIVDGGFTKRVQF
jgi:NAD(P)-dependent dehydrogenase (short-subunit alcohol dehydrogenase family)